MDKAPDAFRTISEVADELDLPQHVLRFWETRFAQIRPMKRGGGRRYYRPDDVDLLRGIRHLLYGEGYTIRGVQRILKDHGVRFVQTVWQAGAPQPAKSPGDLEEAPAGKGEGAPERGRGLFGLLPAFTLSGAIGRRNAFNMHPPNAVFLLLLFLSCLCAFIAGFVIKPGHNNWLHMVTFAAIVSLTIGAILDIEYPHHGLIRLTSYDRYFVTLRDSMK